MSSCRVTLTVLDGPDRGRVFENLPTPVTIGREEGNAVQLNDERISRFHSKIQEDQGQLVLTDLDSTNGTRLNGELIQLSILRLGDRVSLGRSLLLFGSPDEISEKYLSGKIQEDGGKTWAVGKEEVEEGTSSSELRYELNLGEQGTTASTSTSHHYPSSPPDLPSRLTPAQAAQLSELLLHLHRSLAQATGGNVRQGEEGYQLDNDSWQRILRVEMELARYIYLIGHPEIH